MTKLEWMVKRVAGQAIPHHCLLPVCVKKKGLYAGAR